MFLEKNNPHPSIRQTLTSLYKDKTPQFWGVTESHTAFIKLPLLHSVVFFHSKWRTLEVRLSIYCRENILFWSQGYPPNLPWVFKSSLILISYWVKKSHLFVLSYPQVWQAQIVLSLLSLSSQFLRIFYFLEDGYNYDRVPLNDQRGMS